MSSSPLRAHLIKRALAIILCASTVFLGCSKPETVEVSGFGRELPSDLPALYRPFWNGMISSAEEPALRATLPYERVSLERRTGMTTAPDYRVVFHRSGLAELDDKGGATIGRFTSDLDPYSYARLCYLIERSHFQALPTNYHVSASDQETVVVSVKSAAGEHTVSEYGIIGPIELWTIQQTIDGLKAKTSWQPVE